MIDWNPYAKADVRREDLTEAAVRMQDEHAITFAEVCLRAHALNPRPLFLLAARQAAGQLGCFLLW